MGPKTGKFCFKGKDYPTNLSDTYIGGTSQ